MGVRDLHVKGHNKCLGTPKWRSPSVTTPPKGIPIALMGMQFQIGSHTDRQHDTEPPEESVAQV